MQEKCEMRALQHCRVIGVKFLWSTSAGTNAKSIEVSRHKTVQNIVTDQDEKTDILVTISANIISWQQILERGSLTEKAGETEVNT